MGTSKELIMKKSKDHLASEKIQGVKRKAVNVQTAASEVKKKRKLKNIHTDPSGSPRKAQDIVKSTKDPTGKKIGVKNKNTALLQKKSLKQKGKINGQKQVLNSVNRVQDAPASSGLNLAKKKKKKLKVKLQQANINGVSPSAKGLVKAAPHTVDLLKKNKLPDASISKKNVTLSNIGTDASPNSGDASKQAKKKKKKNKLYQEPLKVSSSDGSQSNSPFKSLKQNKKNHNVQGQAKPDASKLLKKNKKLNINNNSKQQKESEVKRNSTNSGQTLPLKEQGTVTEQKVRLKGKALKRHIANIVKAISKLKKFQNTQERFLLKPKSEGHEKKILKAIKRIKLKIAKLETDLSVYQPVKENTEKIAKPIAFKNLPEGPKPKKKEKQAELKEFLENQMKSARFRWLNENLYTSSSEEAKGFFKEDPESFKAYHEGYSEQVAKWPINPLDVIINELKKLPKDSVVADLGCGEAKLAAALPKLKVHSLDFIALKPEVIACDMAHCPLLRSSVDVAVFCLSLMGTNISDFLLEANRILKTGGTMEIAEVESRFDSIDDFVEKVQKYGFQLKKKNSIDMFFFLTFTKRQDITKSGKLPGIDLKACVYKKR